MGDRGYCHCADLPIANDACPARPRRHLNRCSGTLAPARRARCSSTSGKTGEAGVSRKPGRTYHVDGIGDHRQVDRRRRLTATLILFSASTMAQGLRPRRVFWRGDPIVDGVGGYGLGVYVQPEMRQSVCFVCANIGGDLKPVGTAFFFSLATPPVQWLFVVTALHVVSNVQLKSADGTAFVNSDDGKTFVRVNTKDGGFKVVEVTEDKWVKPDMSAGEIIDITFCQWEVLPSASDFDFRAIGAELAATKDVMAAEQIGVGNEIAFAGLFVNHHGQKRNEPIVRFGNICGMPAEPVSTRVGDIEAYLVESRSVGGLSGSPVFVDVGNYRVVDNVRQYRYGDDKVLYLLGVVNAHFDVFVEQAAVDVSPSDEHVNKGIAVVTPIDKVLNVIQQSRIGRAMKQAAEAAVQQLQAMNPADLAALRAQGPVKLEFPFNPDGGDIEPDAV